MIQNNDKYLKGIKYIQKGYKNSFNIVMKNLTIYTKTGVQKTSQLTSKFCREIYEQPLPNVGFAKYTLIESKYCAPDCDQFMVWSFAKNLEFYNALYYLPNQEEKQKYYQEAQLTPPFPTLEQSFKEYPRLPSVFLTVLQANDIITFDAFLCMIHSNLFSTSFSTEYILIKDMINRKIDIGAGVYSKESHYWNNNLYIRFIGKGDYKGKCCLVAQYTSDPSNIFMKDDHTKQEKTSISIYSGNIYICYETGEILYGELEEDIITIGDVDQYTKRKVILTNQGEF